MVVPECCGGTQPGYSRRALTAVVDTSVVGTVAAGAVVVLVAVAVAVVVTISGAVVVAAAAGDAVGDGGPVAAVPAVEVVDATADAAVAEHQPVGPRQRTDSDAASYCRTGSASIQRAGNGCARCLSACCPDRRRVEAVDWAGQGSVPVPGVREPARAGADERYH